MRTSWNSAATTAMPTSFDEPGLLSYLAQDPVSVDCDSQIERPKKRRRCSFAQDSISQMSANDLEDGPNKPRRVDPNKLALRLDPDLVKEMDAYIEPGAIMPSFAIRKELQTRYNVDRRHLYDYFHSRGLRVAKEDKFNNLARSRASKNENRTTNNTQPPSKPPSKPAKNLPRQRASLANKKSRPMLADFPRNSSSTSVSSEGGHATVAPQRLLSPFSEPPSQAKPQPSTKNDYENEEFSTAFDGRTPAWMQECRERYGEYSFKSDDYVLDMPQWSLSDNANYDYTFLDSCIDHIPGGSDSLGSCKPCTSDVQDWYYPLPEESTITPTNIHISELATNDCTATLQGDVEDLTLSAASSIMRMPPNLRCSPWLPDSQLPEASIDPHAIFTLYTTMYDPSSPVQPRCPAAVDAELLHNIAVCNSSDLSPAYARQHSNTCDAMPPPPPTIGRSMPWTASFARHGRIRTASAGGGI